MVRRYWEYAGADVDRAAGVPAPREGRPLRLAGSRRPAPLATSLLRHPALAVGSREAPGGEALQQGLDPRGLDLLGEEAADLLAGEAFGAGAAKGDQEAVPADGRFAHWGESKTAATR